MTKFQHAFIHKGIEASVVFSIKSFKFLSLQPVRTSRAYHGRNVEVIAFGIGFKHQIIQAVDGLAIITGATGHDVETRAAGQTVISDTCLQYVVARIAI